MDGTTRSHGGRGRAGGECAEFAGDHDGRVGALRGGENRDPDCVAAGMDEAHGGESQDEGGGRDAVWSFVEAVDGVACPAGDGR